MGYIEYCIEYDNGEVWGETRPFYDSSDMIRVTTQEYCQALAEEYRAMNVLVVGVRMNDEQFITTYVGKLA